ncbi:DNA/RNA non-specific endonuclease [Geminisphaera colitermitum]|uniref:DNA/RNA non-specific endonuclease n=1 Tax=Geminisphaera colitermitum TaxID=1148786 RepID=UPI000158D5DF|nr:DNA/RNA non-specific endonuclease [Geminisphaera colitermitum]
MCARRSSSFGKSSRSSRSRRGGGGVWQRLIRRTKLGGWVTLALGVTLGVWFAFQPPARQQEVTRLARNTFDRQKKINLFQFAGDLWRLYYGQDFVAITTAAPGDHTFIYGGVPRSPGIDHQLRTLTNTAYVVGYSDVLGNPVWAAYRMSDISPLPEPAARPETFDVDARTIARITPGDYTGSGYDRGHLAPNYAIATRYGEKAQRETFLMSNIIPQRHSLNAGLWKQLEMKIAVNYPARFGEVWVLAGPVFGPKPKTLRGGVAVPEACYMIVLDESDGRLRCQAFIFPQNAEGDMGRYLVTIDEIEQRTGLDFLHELPGEAEALLESRRADSVW